MHRFPPEESSFLALWNILDKRDHGDNGWVSCRGEVTCGFSSSTAVKERPTQACEGLGPELGHW